MLGRILFYLILEHRKCHPACLHLVSALPATAVLHVLCAPNTVWDAVGPSTFRTAGAQPQMRLWCPLWMLMHALKRRCIAWTLLAALSAAPHLMSDLPCWITTLHMKTVSCGVCFVSDDYYRCCCLVRHAVAVKVKSAKQQL
jgi:hypothetical protein